MSRLADISRLCVRVAFLAAALAYACLSLLSDSLYGAALLTGNMQYFELSALYFPLIRSHRSGPGYFAALLGDPKGISYIEEALRHDPNAADLWLALTRMTLNTPERLGYNSSFAHLQALTPGLRFNVVPIRRGE